MATDKPGPTVFIIFGAGGDLAWRKLFPALYNLFLDRWMPEKFMIIGLGHGHMSNEGFRKHLRQGVDQFSRRGKTEERTWGEFASHLSFMSAEVSDPKIYAHLTKTLLALDKAWSTQANRIFYLGVPPHLTEPVAQGLAKARLNTDRKQARIVVESPLAAILTRPRN